MTIGLSGPETETIAQAYERPAALIDPPRLSWFARVLAVAGRWLRQNQRVIQRIQWGVVLIYIGLVATPAFLPLPERTAHIWNDLTVFAQFAFWGLWWPFVLLSMIIAGRSWCGLFCPEGALTEMASSRSLGLAVPRWITWKGWPFAAFVMTTVYGQMVSVYQYPKPALLILGGSTLGAIAVGFLYGRNKRVWCRYLCPVNGVFGLLAKLAPIHFRVDQDAWERSRRAGNAGARAINCAPLVPIRNMRGASECHMCGRCESFRDAIELAPRSPNSEIVQVAGATPKPWETLLIVFGLMGVAGGAFQWSGSPWYVAIKQGAAEWLIDHGMMWPMRLQPPWWILTNYPDLNDQMTLLDGAVVLFYIGATAAIIGGAVLLCLLAAARSLGPWSPRRFHHLAQSLIPIAACGVFLGLSATTVTLLRAEGFPIAHIDLLRGALLGGAALWSAVLGWSIAGRYTSRRPRQAAAASFVTLAASAGAVSSILTFFVW